MLAEAARSAAALCLVKKPRAWRSEVPLAGRVVSTIGPHGAPGQAAAAPPGGSRGVVSSVALVPSHGLHRHCVNLD